MQQLVTGLGVVNAVIFVALSLLALRRWLTRRDRAAGWLAVAFVSLGLIVSFGRLLPSHPHGFVLGGLLRLEIEALVLFPYLLYRFATVFAPPSRRLQQLVAALTILLSVWTFLLPKIPTTGETRSSGFVVYLIAFLVHWTVLSVVVAVRLWRAGRDQPNVARWRMRMLAFASATLTIALISTAFEKHAHGAGAAAVALLATLSGATFLIGLAPPLLVRGLWRAPEQQRLQEAIRSLMTLATTRAEVAERVLGPVAAMVGAGAAAILDGDGKLLSARGLTPDAVARLQAGERGSVVGPGELVNIEAPGATVLVWTSTYAPFFGEDELQVLATVGALTGIAIDRVRLFEQEHASRLALEHANEVMADFVALAAHELRTPVTTVHGFVQTLHHLGDRLDEEKKAELRLALEQQTARMASLVEQLLDLSRLDAKAVEVRPQRVDLRPYLVDAVVVAAGARLDDVELDLPESLDATVDASILDHIVTNLVTNAFRYGSPPVRVRARCENGSVLVTVEDSGPGVATELEETLFERFTRAGVSRDRVAGTGLGLAIARAYARAHRGDVRYERGHAGARFVVELPSGSG